MLLSRSPNAVRCADLIHGVKWATEALDVVRRQPWNARPRTRRTYDAYADRRHERKAAPVMRGR